MSNINERRLKFHGTLLQIAGNNEVYFQPPESLRLKTPCIIYTRANVYRNNADNKLYFSKTAYDVIVIDEDPDSELMEKIHEVPNSTFIRHYTSDNKNYDVFRIYY